METPPKQDNNRTSKINYKTKNLQYIEKLKEKKQKELQQKAFLQKKELHKRQSLKKKILQEAKALKKIQIQELDFNSNEVQIDQRAHRQNGHRSTKAVQSLPKIASNTQEIQKQRRNPEYHKQRYLSFLQNLHNNIKSKKQLQEQEKKRKEVKYAKLRQQLGVDKIQSKLAIELKGRQEKLVRTHSAQSIKPINDEEDQLPRTNKNFKRKNQQYIQKIKRRRQDQQKAKDEQKKKKQKIKERLKDFVLVTVKKNVLDGVYDDELEKKKPKQNNKENLQKNDEVGQQKSGQSQSQEPQIEGSKKKKRKMRAFPHVTDINEWKKKNRLEPQNKIFIVTGGYNDLKKALKERGWYQNPDVNSPCFDLKYTLQGREIDYGRLEDFQMANHFQKNGAITTKIGLTRTLRSLRWINDTSEDNFYPKCFDLNDEDDNVGFQLHFKICKALSIIKIYSDYFSEKKCNNDQNKKYEKQTKATITDLKLRVQIALSVLRKNIQDLDQIIDKNKIPKIVTDKEWEILAQDELNEQGLAKKKHEQWLKSIDCKYNTAPNKIKKTQKKQKKSKKVKKEKQQDVKQQSSSQSEQENNQLFDQVTQILDIYEKKYPQFYLTGHNNIWILKPAGLSRGRGITCYNNLIEIQDHIKCKESLWIAQKYIENPVIVLNRKFDIRQWVLVTDFNPLTIWLYQQPYIRFSAIDYDPKQVSNKFIHLTNNSIGKHHKAEKEHIKGNMFFIEDFRNYLMQLQHTDIYQEKIKPQIKEIVKLSLMCGAQCIQNRKNSHQLFGYDLMVDTNYKVWLIQINSSPSMDYSTHVTSKLVKQCLTDIPKVIVDHASAPKKQKKHIDTGKFKRIYKGIEVPQKPINTGLNLMLQGVAVKKPKKNFVKVKNFSLDNKNK